MMKKSLLIIIVIFWMVILLIGCNNYDVKRTDKVSPYNQIEHHVVEKDNGVNPAMKAYYNDGKMKIFYKNCILLHK